MSDYVTVDVHNQFVKRMEDENHRQNKRISECEESIKQMGEIVRSIDRLTTSVESLASDIQKQGVRLEAIEKEPAENWKKATWEVIKYAIVLVLGIVAIKIGAAI
jgi:hypothetical protein